MFKPTEFYRDGLTTKLNLDIHTGAIKEVLERNLQQYNSPAAMAAIQSRTAVYKMLRETDIPVAVALTEELDASQYHIPPLVGYAEPRTDGGVQFNLCFSKEADASSIMMVAEHELIHAQDMRDGRLVMDYANNAIYWDGERYESMPLPRIGEVDFRHEYVDMAIAFAKYAAQPWEARANANMWHRIFAGFGELVEAYGVVWSNEWNESAIREYMLNNEVELDVAVKMAK